MFHKIKQFKDLRTQAKAMEKKMSAEVVDVEENGVRVTMDGTQAIHVLNIPTDLLSPEKKEKAEKAIVHAIDAARKKVQRKMAEKMIKEGGLENLNFPKF